MVLSIFIKVFFFNFIVFFMVDIKGKFIAIEGIDGSGKTTQVKALNIYYNQFENIKDGNRMNFLVTREPSSGKFGILLREVLKDKTIDPLIDALLFTTDRIDHYARDVIPFLEHGWNIITDRCYMSSLAYQNVQFQKKYNYRLTQWLVNLNQFCLTPDLIIYIDISPEETAKRLAKSRTDNDIEKFENIEFQKLLRNEYKFLIDQKIISTRIEEINGELPTEKVTELIVKAIQKTINS